MRNEELYRKKKCEVCGAVAFEKLINEKVTDGGYSTDRQFEDSGFGCIVVVCHDLNNLERKRDEVHVCPRCAQKIMDAFHMANDQAKISFL